MPRFDIEGGSTYWSDVATNVAFFEDMLQQAQSMGNQLLLQMHSNLYSFIGDDSLPIVFAQA